MLVWQPKKLIKELADREALRDWGRRNNYMEIPTEFPHETLFEKAHAFGRQIIKSSSEILKP